MIVSNRGIAFRGTVVSKSTGRMETADWSERGHFDGACAGTSIAHSADEPRRLLDRRRRDWRRRIDLRPSVSVWIAPEMTGIPGRTDQSRNRVVE
jgi:hypothetical protein